MLKAMMSNPMQNERAKYFPDKDDLTKQKMFRCEVVSEKEIQYSQPIQNLITAQGSTVIKTSWGLPFKVQDKIYFRGSFWIVNNIKSLTLDVNPQAIPLVGYKFNQYTVMELIESE